MQTSDNRKGASFRMHFPYIQTDRERQTDIQTYRHTYIHTDIHTYIHTHTHIHTSTHPHMHTRTHAHTHTRTHTHIHTYTYTQTYRHTDIQTYRHYITLHSIALHCIAVQYITLHYIHTYIYIILFKICFSAYNTRTLQKIVSNCPQTILYITRQKLWLRQSLLETLFSHCPQSRSSTANWLSMCPNNVN